MFYCEFYDEPSLSDIDRRFRRINRVGTGLDHFGKGVAKFLVGFGLGRKYKFYAQCLRSILQRFRVEAAGRVHYDGYTGYRGDGLLQKL